MENHQQPLHTLLHGLSMILTKTDHLDLCQSRNISLLFLTKAHRVKFPSPRRPRHLAKRFWRHLNDTNCICNDNLAYLNYRRIVDAEIVSPAPP